jgi:hypothetical protein
VTQPEINAAAVSAARQRRRLSSVMSADRSRCRVTLQCVNAPVHDPTIDIDLEIFGMPFRCFLFFALLGFSTAASAVEVRVGPSVRLNLPSAPGFCQLDASNPQDKIGLTNTQKMIEPNVLLASFADCNQLKTWRTTKGYYLRDFIQVQSPPDAPEIKRTSEDIKKTCDELHSAGEKIANDNLPNLRERADKIMKSDVQGSQFLGVLETKPDVCFSALVQKQTAQGGEKQTILVVWATTVVRERILFYYLFGPYEDSTTISTALANVKVYYNDLVQANR